MDVKSRLASNMRNQVLKQYKLNETKRELKKKDSKITSIIYYNNEQNVLVGYNNGKLKRAENLSAVKAGNLTDTTIKKDGERLSPVQINDMNKTYRQIWQFEGETYGVKPGKIERLENGGGDITNIGDVKGWEYSILAWKDLNDHCGEFGSDKDFCVNQNVGIDGCCQVNSNPYYTSSTNSWGIIIQIGQNTPNDYIKWGTDFIFDNHLDTNIPSDALLFTVPEISGQCGDGSRRVRFNHKIKAIMKIFYNYKYQSIPCLELYYRDENYPSRPDRYPWNFMFIFAREDSKCYYQTYDSGKEKINYLGRVDLTGYAGADAFSTWNGGSYNGRAVKYGNKMRMNWYTKDMYSSSTGVGLRYYLKRAMKDNQYSGDKTISGGGL